MLRERLLVGIIGGIAAVALMLFGGEALFGIVIAVIALMGLYEMYSALGFIQNNIPLAVIGFVAGGVLMAVMNGVLVTYDLIKAVALAFMAVLLIYMVIAHNKTGFADISMCLFATFYVVAFFMHLSMLRNLTYGIFLIWIPIIIAWLSDTFAYTFGRLFGKHKLIPEVSPKKTVEGAVGGVLGGIVFMVIYGLVCVFCFDKSVNWLSIILLGGFGSILSQLGDLAASWIKREKGIKDYGNLLPGHGGVMDRFDSVLIVAPFVYYFIELLPVF